MFYFIKINAYAVYSATNIMIAGLSYDKTKSNFFSFQGLFLYDKELHLLQKTTAIV